jgi:hypothetical protein
MCAAWAHSASRLLRARACAVCVRMCIVHAPPLGPTRSWHVHVHAHVSTCVAYVPRAGRVWAAACELPSRPLQPRLTAPVPCCRRAALGATRARLRVWDAFVVRYDAAAQRSLPLHQDDSHLSLTIALNAGDEFDGGGTGFADVHGGSRASPLVVQPRLGHAVAFPGALWHGGEPITRGRRYVIAAFLWVASEAAVEAEALEARSLPSPP